MDTEFLEGTYTPSRYAVQIDGIEEAHADELSEAVMVAGYLHDQRRGFVAIADHEREELVLGWWLLDPKTTPQSHGRQTSKVRRYERGES